jgi:hypothetical protein
MTLSPAAIRELERAKVIAPRRRSEENDHRHGLSIDVGAVLKAGATALGFNPTDTRYFNRYISDMENEHIKSCTCIRCGRVGLKRRSISVTDPVTMLRNLSELNGKLKGIFPILKKRRVERKPNRDVILYNGFCSICVGSMDENMPNAFRFDAPDEHDFDVLKCLVVECVRLGATQEAIYDLERIVRDHTNQEEEDLE